MIIRTGRDVFRSYFYQPDGVKALKWQKLMALVGPKKPPLKAIRPYVKGANPNDKGKNNSRRRCLLCVTSKEAVFNGPNTAGAHGTNFTNYPHHALMNGKNLYNL